MCRRWRCRATTLYAGGSFFTTAGGIPAKLHRAMEREQLVGAGFGHELSMCMRWRCRAARCMRAAISRRRAVTRPITSRNGTGAVGRRLASGDDPTLCMRWRCRAARCMPAAISRRRAATRPITSPNGTGAVGQPWGRHSGTNHRSTSTCPVRHLREAWRCRAARCMWVAYSTYRRRPDRLIIAQWNGSSWSVPGLWECMAAWLRWRCQATLYAAAVSRRRAATRPIISPNGTGAVGRRWGRGMNS